MNNYMNHVPDFNKHLSEAEDFLKKITDNDIVVERWSLIRKNLFMVWSRLAKLEKKWKAHKQSTGRNPYRMIRSDMDHLVHQLDVGISLDETAIDWGIRSSQSMIDQFPCVLPYLRHTDFYVYTKEISDLLEQVIMKTRHGEVMKLLRELKDHPDIRTIGQFSTNEMVECYRYLEESKEPENRKELVQYLDIYQKLCGIYDKDMILCYCLLELKQKGVRPEYKEAHPSRRKPQGINAYVKKRMKSFGKVHDTNLRNADAHNDIETDSKNHSVTIYRGRDKNPKSYTYQDIVSTTENMSALIIAFRLLIIILNNYQWRMLKAVLK